MTPGTFPDAETGFIAFIDPTFGSASTSTPADWAGMLPFHRVTVIGGRDDSLTDVSRVVVDTFGATRAAARDAAEQVRQALTARGARIVTGVGIFDQITTDTKPHAVPWTSEASPVRYTHAYRAAARRN